MFELELIVVLQVVVAILVYVARRIRVPYPILLVLGGLALAAIPGLPHVELEPEVVLLLFLPPILFFAGYNTPFRDFRANSRPILLLAVGLVVFTAAAVAVVMNAAVPEMGLAAAFALGAIVSPPDAIAATAIFRSLGAPHRIVTILEGESLLNDATALVAYRTAVVAAITGVFVLGDAVIQFVYVAAAGVALGLVVGGVAAWLFARMDDPPVEVAISLILPFAAYLPAEHLGISGVTASVTAGLYLGRQSARVLSSATRVLGASTWQIVIFSLEGFAFILIGLALPQILEGLSMRPIGQLAFLAALVSLTVIVARVLWVYPATYLPRLIPAIGRNDPPPPLRVPFVVAWSGMRGAVSLAAALALPRDFPERDLILFLTLVVILVTLVGQGLTLPLVLRLAGVAGGDQRIEEEETVARQAASDAALAEIAELRHRWPDHGPMLDQIEAMYSHRTEPLPSAHEHTADDEHERELIEHQAIRGAVLRAERDAVIALRDRGAINDEVLRRVEREIDLEVLRMEA